MQVGKRVFGVTANGAMTIYPLVWVEGHAI